MNMRKLNEKIDNVLKETKLQIVNILQSDGNANSTAEFKRLADAEEFFDEIQDAEVFLLVNWMSGEYAKTVSTEEFEALRTMPYTRVMKDGKFCKILRIKKPLKKIKWYICIAHVDSEQ